MKCDIEFCPHPAHSKVIWGESDRQKGTFCKEHIDDLWSKVKGLVAIGRLFWTQEPVAEKKCG